MRKMVEEFLESLYDEFITLQRLDPHFQGKKIRLDNEFYTLDYQNFLKEEGREVGILAEDELVEEEEEEELEFITLTQDEVMIKVVDILDQYREIYTVPPVNIRNQEWEMLFDHIFKYYENHGLSICYAEDMIGLNRLAITRSLLYEKSALEIEDYIKSIEYLDSRVIYPNNKKELIEELQEEIPSRKVISFQKYLTKSTFDKKV